MAKLTDIAIDLRDPKLLGAFIAATEMIAFEILMNVQATEGQKAWAARAVLNFESRRSRWYGELVLKGLAATSAEFRALIEQYKEEPDSVEVSDQELRAFFAPWIALFVATGA